MASKEDIRPIYAEPQGYLSQAPSEKMAGPILDANLWEQANQAIDELNQISGEDYSRFKLAPQQPAGSMASYLGRDTYRGKLGGLISRLHGKYFADEPPPFSGMPATVISQNQIQSQSVQVQILLDLQSKIDEKLHKFEEGSKERTFLEKLKGSLSSVKNIVGLIALLTKTASEYGLTIEQLKELFQ
jgi:hypothetical protein